MTCALISAPGRTFALACQPSTLETLAPFLRTNYFRLKGVSQSTAEAAAELLYK